ncbi:MAG: KH domain-containing protein, partial [Clostridia bacterium]
IVSDKDAVEIEAKKEDRFTLYIVRVSGSDLGSVIGKNGKIAEAIRTVVKSANSRERMRIKFEAK